MPSYFRPTRNVELSTLYYLENSLNSDWSGITVVKKFTDAYKEPLPVIAMNISNVYSHRKEVGATTLLNDYVLSIDIFASSDGQRIDLADYITDKIKDNWTFYTHSQTPGSPTSLTRVANGSLFVTRFSSSYKVDLGSEGVNTYDRFRHYIEVTVRTSQ